MQYLVTGGQGVIGSRLVRELRSRGHDVVVVDRVPGATDDDLGADVTRFEEVWRIFEERKVDSVIHLAGEVGRMVGELNPIRMAHVNLVGTMNLIQLSMKHDARFVLFSTSEVYGDLHDKPLCEELEATVPFDPTNVYALSKMFAERVTRHYHRNYGLKAVMIRPFMIYGPGEYPGRYRSALSNFIAKALRGETLTVHRGTVRSWTYVDDFLEGLLLACEKGDFARCRVYNLGRDEPRPMEEVAQTVLKLAGPTGATVRIEDPPTKFLSPVKFGCFHRAREELGFVAKTPLETGVRRTMEWQRQAVLGDAKA